MGEAMGANADSLVSEGRKALPFLKALVALLEKVSDSGVSLASDEVEEFVKDEIARARRGTSGENRRRALVEKDSTITVHEVYERCHRVSPFPPKQHEVMDLLFRDGLTPTQVAAVLQKSRSTIYGLIERAIRRIRKLEPNFVLPRGTRTRHYSE